MRGGEFCDVFPIRAPVLSAAQRCRVIPTKEESTRSLQARSLSTRFLAALGMTPLSPGNFGATEVLR